MKRFVGYLYLYLFIFNSLSLAYDTKGTHVIVDMWNVTIPDYNNFNDFIINSAVESDIHI